MIQQQQQKTILFHLILTFHYQIGIKINFCYLFISDMSVEQNLLINIIDQIVLLDESFSSNGKIILREIFH